MKLAFVYDRVNKMGGAERVLQALHEIWPKAPLFTAVYDLGRAPWSKQFEVHPSFVNNIPYARRHHELFPLLMPYAFESFDLSAYDVVISITSAEAKGILTGPHQLHLCYMLTPTRYLWSHQDEYAGRGLIGTIRYGCMEWLKKWDMVAASRPDKIVSISKAVDARVKRYYHRTSDAIIYPPVETTIFEKHPPSCCHPQENYFLVVSRLVPYKRVDLAIEACNQLKARLIVVGTGSEMHRLKRLAGETITLLGSVDDLTLACLYHHATALIFPQEEEFGMTALEAQAAGIPVIAYARGAALETVIPEVTGLLFNQQTVTSLVKALQTLKNHTWYDKTIQEHARQFSRSMFCTRFKAFVEESWHQQLSHA